ncbi:MAG: hypothetical protein JST29_12300 [Bacteroidetes bacterium]|nr:hypothetical protein [Bacteroidota bacterium]
MPEETKHIDKKNNNKIIIGIATFLVFVIVASPYTNMFGRSFKSYNDYTCCKEGQLYTYHYYTEYFFWIKVKTGFTKEKIGKPSAGGCNIECPR